MFWLRTRWLLIVMRSRSQPAWRVAALGRGRVTAGELLPSDAVPSLGAAPSPVNLHRYGLGDLGLTLPQLETEFESFLPRRFDPHLHRRRKIFVRAAVSRRTTVGIDATEHCAQGSSWEFG
jgi:hypothetical protein